MRICFFGTYTVAAGYPVNRYLIQGLRQAGVQLEECRVDLWSGFLHETFGAARWRPLFRLALRGLGGYARLIWRYGRSGAHDWVIVGYPGYADVLLARLLNLWRRRPIALVAFISLYDTLVLDRARVAEGSLRSSLLRRLDRVAFRAADLVLVDTLAQGRFYAETFDLDPEHFRRSFVGHEFGEEAGDPGTRRRPGGKLQVLFFGTYVPLHGVDVILGAAEQLRGEEDVEFTLIGRGQLFDAMQQRVTARGLENVRLITEWHNAAALRAQVLASDVCLGVFGTTAKAARVVPYKVLGALALCRPVVTRDGPGIRELLVDNESALLCPAGDADALARALLRLRQEPGLAAQLATAGHAAYVRHSAPGAVGRSLLNTLTEATGAV
jgi:glycosyltransferase involved in cell wall biosynthesis